MPKFLQQFLSIHLPLLSSVIATNETLPYCQSQEKLKSSPSQSCSALLIPRSLEEIAHGSNILENKQLPVNNHLKLKVQEISILKKENENLRCELQRKDEDHNRIKQIWRKEADDTIRNLKISYNDVLLQSRLLEKQLESSDKEKAKLRKDKDDIEKHHTELQAKFAAHSLLLQKEKQTALLSDDESKEGRCSTLPAKLQTLLKDNKDLAVALTSKDDQFKKLQLSVKKNEESLRKETENCKNLTKENANLKSNFLFISLFFFF